MYMCLMKWSIHMMLGFVLICLAPFVRAAELVMVEEQGCHWCEQWKEEIGVVYHKTDEGRAAPLRPVDIHDLPADLTLHSRPQFTPTFILVENGEEVGRIEGYPGEDFFWPLLARLIEKLPKGGGA